MKILLTHTFFLEELKDAGQAFPPPPPLSLLSMSRLLKDNGFKNKIYDSTFKNRNSFANYLLRHKPVFLVIYTWRNAEDPFFKELKELRTRPSLKNTYIILAGPGAASASDIFILNGIDMVIYGEEEETLLELIENMDKTHSPFLDHVKGLVFRNAKGGITRTGPRHIRLNEDDSPLPDRKTIPLNNYFSATEDFAGKNIFPLRACLHEEKYSSIDGYHLHRFAPEKVTEDLKKGIRKFKAESFLFLDRDFPGDYFWLKSFAQHMENLGLKIRYQCFALAENLTEEKLEVLAGSGCEKLHFVVFSPLEELPLLRQIIRSSGKKMPGAYLHIGLFADAPLMEEITQIRNLILENPSMGIRFFTSGGNNQNGPFPIIFPEIRNQRPVKESIVMEIKDYLGKELDYQQGQSQNPGFFKKMLLNFNINRARKKIRAILP